MDNFMVSSKDGKTRVDHAQDVFLSWRKKQKMVLGIRVE